MSANRLDTADDTPMEEPLVEDEEEPQPMEEKQNHSRESVDNEEEEPWRDDEERKLLPVCRARNSKRIIAFPSIAKC